jgi:hypothetical protein
MLSVYRVALSLYADQREALTEIRAKARATLIKSWGRTETGRDNRGFLTQTACFSFFHTTVFRLGRWAFKPMIKSALP